MTWQEVQWAPQTTFKSPRSWPQQLAIFVLSRYSLLGPRRHLTLFPHIPSVVGSCDFYWSPSTHTFLSTCPVLALSRAHDIHPGPSKSLGLSLSLLQEITTSVVLCPQNLKRPLTPQYVIQSHHLLNQSSQVAFAFFEVLLHLSFTPFFQQANAQTSCCNFENVDALLIQIFSTPP